MKTKLIIEKNDEGFWGQLETLPAVFCHGTTIEELLVHAQESADLYYRTIDEKKQDFQFELVMDLQSFFESNDYINISQLARKIDINPSLLRQYAKGIKYPGINQVKKIENGIKQIGKALSEIGLQPF
jgi:predicted RNase H-like HicB family nuclease